MKTVRSKIRQLTAYSRKRVPMPKIVNDLNLVIRGWRNYFSVGNSTKHHYAWLSLQAHIENRRRWAALLSISMRPSSE
jgi:hypothetical protein